MTKYKEEIEELKQELADTWKVTLSLLEDGDEARCRIEEYSKILEERTYELSVLYELSRQIGYTLDYGKLSHLILTFLHKIAKYDICVSFLLKGASGDMTIKLARSLDNKTIEQAKAFLFDAFKQVSDADIDERNLTMEVGTTDEFVKENPPLKGEIRSFFNVPLLVRDKAVGMINISSLKQNAFTEGHIRLLYTIANQASVAIERLQALIKSEKSKIEKAVESMADGVIMIDQNREIVIINPAARKALRLDSYQGATPDVEGITKLLGYDPVELLRKKDGTSVKNEVSIHGMDYQAQVSSVVGSKEEVLGIVVALRDISREKKIDQMKSEFISIVSHELRTPLTSIKNAVSIILGGTAGEITKNQERFLSMANRNIDRLAGIINDLLDLSKLEAGKAELRFQEVDLNEPLDATISSLIPQAEKKSITITKGIPVDLPKVYGDRDRIEQIFINLINNSIKFTPEGGHVHISAKNHELDGDFIEVCVEDTGIGIPVEELDMVFNKFHQISGSLTRTTGGTGLGLPIVKELVGGHKGNIRVESKVGKGSGFIFTLPAYSPESASKHYLDMEIERARKMGISLSLVMLEIKESGYLSEVCGEEETLKILEQVKQVVQDTVRRTTDIINIQITGWVIITLVDTPKEGAFALDNRLKEMLSKHTFKVGKESVKINLASGIATYPEEGVTGDELMEKALLAMKQGSGEGSEGQGKDEHRTSNVQHRTLNEKK